MKFDHKSKNKMRKKKKGIQTKYKDVICWWVEQEEANKYKQAHMFLMQEFI